MRTVGTLAVVYGLILGVIGDDWSTGWVLIVVVWLIRRATRPGLSHKGQAKGQDRLIRL